MVKVVVAFDFGTTEIGCAYRMRSASSSSASSQLKMPVIPLSSGKRNKTRAALLLNSDLEFVALGEDAFVARCALSDGLF